MCLLAGPVGLTPRLLHAADSALDSSEEPSEAGDSGTPAGHSHHGEAFNEGPRQAAVLLEGMGNVELPAPQASETVQAFLNQGLAALHGFWYLEAERSFRHAAMLQPDLAIAYWGMALANENNTSRARGLIDEAVQRRDQASPWQRLHIDALAAYLEKPEKSENADQKKKRIQTYINNLEGVLNEFPDCVETRALLAVRLWLARKTMPITSHHAVNALLGEVFAANPMHPAHHYRIHLWDAVHPSNALHSSAMCGPALPAVAHMWHMPGHIYSKLHRYEDAVWQQQASARVDHRHMTRARLMPDQIHNFAHNNEWMIRNLLYLGSVDEALAQSRNLVAMPQHPKYNTPSKRGSFKYGRMRLLQTLTEYELWQQLLVDAERGYLATTSDRKLDQERRQWIVAAHHLTSDSAAAKKAARPLGRQCLKAQQQVLDLEKALDELDEEQRKKDKRQQELKRAKQRAEELNQAIALGEAAAAVAAQDAAAAKDALQRCEKIDDVLAASWIGQAGDLDESIKRLEKLVDRRTNQLRPLAILVDHLWRAQRHDEAISRFNNLRTLAGSADIDTPLLARLAPVIEAAEAPADWPIAAEPADDIGQRPQLDALGSRFWTSYTAPSWQAIAPDDTPISDADYQSKPKLLVFYLGFGCLHCVEQLTAVRPEAQRFEQLGIEIIAISTETVAELNKGIENYGKPFPFTILADPGHDVFKSYRCWDDFEDQPLHGTFLIDAGGAVRWQDIGYEPFDDIDFLIAETKRLMALPAQP